MDTDLQALASTAQDFFPGQQPLHSNMPMSYPQHQPHNGQSYYAPPATSQASYSYGNVSYAVNHGGEVGHQASIESPKQGLEVIRDMVLVGIFKSFPVLATHSRDHYLLGGQHQLEKLSD